MIAQSHEGASQMNLTDRHGRRHIGGGLLLCAVALSGCETLHVSPPAPTAPYFTPTAADTAQLEALTDELIRFAPQCIEPTVCEQVEYARAVVALFKSREEAQTAFRRLIDANPSKPFAESSALWLQLLEEQNHRWLWVDQPQSPLNEIATQLVREWIDRKLSDLRGDRSTVAETRPDSTAEESRQVQTLQRQVQERNRRIAQLSSQLNALKLIDHDVDQRKPSYRLPFTLTHQGTDEDR